MGVRRLICQPMTPRTAFDSLLPRMQELRDLANVIQLLSWDQETFLPPKGLAVRGAQLSTLQGLYHDRLVDPRLGELLAKAHSEAPQGDPRAMLQELERERNRAVKIPEKLVRALADAQSEGLAAWRQARNEKRFSVLAPALKRLLSLRQEEADALALGNERYDSLLDRYEPGMTVERLHPILDRVGQRLAVIVRAIASQPPERPAEWESRVFPVDAQWDFTLLLLKAMGFDLSAGRQDRSIHPFTSSTDPTDVRLTTRLDERNPLSAIFSTLHEGGHGLYEQGFEPCMSRTPLAEGGSMGPHESQSRLWENQVGRSRAFWAFFFPQLKTFFPQALQDVELDGFYKSVNRVKPTLIRTESDEVTYNLHIVLRFQLERAMLNGDLAVDDVPGAWSEKMQALLGIRPAHDVEGALQDIHWSTAEFGYFPTYTLGNLYAASLFAAARRARPSLMDELSRGELLPLLAFLRDTVHRHGSRNTAEERVTQVTGRGLHEEDFFDYLREKFAPLYPGAFPS